MIRHVARAALWWTCGLAAVVAVTVLLSQRYGDPAAMVFAGENAVVLDFHRERRLDIASSPARTFSRAHAEHFSSPDGRATFRLVRMSDGATYHDNLYRVYPDGAEVLVADHIDRELRLWSPDGRYLYFYRQQARRALYYYDVHKDQRELVMENARLVCEGAQCALDHREFARGVQAIYVMNLAHPVPRLVASINKPPLDMRLAWSAGGRWLAYSQPGGGGHQFGVHVYDVRRGQQATLDTLSGLERVQGFSWSADGRWLLLTARGQTGVLDVYTYDTQQAAPRRVDLTARLEGDSAWIHPRWSPTAPRVVFRYTHDNKQNLFLAAATDGTVQQLTHLPSADYMTAHWSPDGKWIAAGVRQRGGCEVRIIDPDTATLRYKLDFTQTKPICDIAFQVRWLLP